MADIETLESCPHCGDDQFYVIVQMRGSGKWHRKLDGTPGQNDTLYDSLNWQMGKRAYCSNCDKYLGPAPQELPDGADPW